MAQDTPMGNTGFGNTTGKEAAGGGMGAATGSDICPTCGASRSQNQGLEQFLGRIGISEEMVRNLRTSMQSVDMEEYLNTARDYLKTGSSKATSYAKENPGKVAAGVAVLAIGAGLLINAMNKE